VVSFAAVVHAIQRFNCIRASATTTAPSRRAASLVVLIDSLVKGPCVCLLRGCPIILLPILRCSTTARINDVDWLGVAMLVFIIMRSRCFVQLQNFSLLLKLAKVLDLRLAEFHELFVQLRHCFGLLFDQMTM
jgi:hypothetical protein